MSRLISCPHCGESDDLTGSVTVSGDRRIECGSCGAGWFRDAEARCATCGGRDIVVRPRELTGHGRATVRSVVGFQEVPMCAMCDAEELNASLAHGRAVSAEYSPAALHAR